MKPAPPTPVIPESTQWALVWWTYTLDLQDSYHTMDGELKRINTTVLETNKHQTSSRKQWSYHELITVARAADIALIDGAGFLYGVKTKDITISTTSLYEIDRLIKDHEWDKEPQESEEIDRLLDEHLPSWLQDDRDVFSKVKADALPPHREGVDHDIQLEGENTLALSPLYSMLIKHLWLMKEYLEEHLKKGYIIPSDVPYVSLVLFAKKPGGGWRFCVDYRKLNAITKKDHYLLLLIEETLARLAGAHIFMKLDIHHAFNHIRLNESAKDLTTFHTRYGSYKYWVLPFGLYNGPASF